MVKSYGKSQELLPVYDRPIIEHVVKEATES